MTALDDIGGEARLRALVEQFYDFDRDIAGGIQPAPLARAGALCGSCANRAV